MRARRSVRRSRASTRPARLRRSAAPAGSRAEDIKRHAPRADKFARLVVAARRRLPGAGAAGLGELGGEGLAGGAGAALVGELAEAGEALGGDSGGDRAAGLVGVAAVAEPAALGERGDVVECEVRGGGGGVGLGQPLAELAHAGRVDPQAAAGAGEQLAPRRGVAAALVAADRAGRLRG